MSLDIPTLRVVIDLAFDFECCPLCGNTKLGCHYCPKCHERIAVCTDAHWFGIYLQNMIKED